MEAVAQPRKSGLAPVADRNARLLICGSLPGDASIQAGRYYAHPRNHFWALLEEAIQVPLQDVGYEARLDALKARGIALWDVIASARRRNSLDSALSEVEVRDLAGFAAGLPCLRAVAFNGGSAARIGRRTLAGTGLKLIDLPSSSPAYTLPLAEKALRWAAIRPFLID